MRLFFGLETLLETFPRLWDTMRDMLQGEIPGLEAELKRAIGENPGPWLDAGCGTGNAAKFFEASDYLGVDPLPGRIALARKKNPGYKFLSGKPSDLAPENKFSGVLLSFVLHHLNDTEALELLEQCRSHLVPGGKLLLPEWMPASAGDPVLHRLAHRVEKPHSRSEETVVKLLQSAGFGDISSVPLTSRRYVFRFFSARRE